MTEKEMGLRLINRQKAEIERLETENKNLLNKLCKKSQTASKVVRKLIRAEAIKEFAERLKKKFFPYGMPDNGNYGINAKAVRETINRVVKEMEGGKDGS